MDNIDLLLESLDAQIEENEAIAHNSPSNILDNVDSSSQNIDESLSEDPDIENVKKSVAKKYSNYGYEIHKQLKEKARNSYNDKGSVTTWKSQSNEKSQQSTLSAPQTATKNDVYAEPIFGLRLINPLVSSQFIQNKMMGRIPITLAKLPNHLNCGNKNADWVFAGAIVFKSGLRTSQKGSQYCLWKISDLKHDLKQVTLYLFGKAGSELWKHSLGSVVAVLNASPMNKDETVSKDDITLSVRNPDQVMIWGISRDYGICKAKKKNGDDCTSFVNKSICEFCLYHVKSEYNKYTGKRSDLKGTFSNGLTDLRNKVLGKSEVFYGGKSYTALKPPKNNKIREKDNTILTSLSLNPQSSELFKSKKITSDQQTLEKLRENTPITSKPRNDTPVDKPLVSARLKVFKEAGKKLIETGEVTRITAVSLKKRKTYVSFADMFSPENCTTAPDKMETDKKSKPTTNPRKEDSQKTPITLKPCKEIVLDIDEPILRKISTQSQNSVKPSTSKISNTGPSLPSQEPIKNSNSSYPRPQSKSPVQLASKTTERTNDDSELLKFKMQSLMHRSQPTNLIHKKRLDQAKMNAVQLIKKKGGLAKANPNEIRSKSDDKRKAAVKRALEENDEETTESTEMESLKKSVLSERFIELMNAHSTHENLAQLAADMEEQNYFNKMEKKEQLEEKMLSTYKVPCKAVSCLKCKYKWFSASDRCKAEGHPIKVIDAVKRFFKCHNCSNRCVSLEIVPLISCKQCGSSNWSRAPMIKEKICQPTANLSIRGDEVKFLDSFGQKQNLDLLVPE